MQRRGFIRSTLGSLHATQGGKPKDRIRKALECSEQFSAGVRSPFVIEKLKEK